MTPTEKLEEETIAFPGSLFLKALLLFRRGRNSSTMIDIPFHQKFALHQEVMAGLCTTEDALGEVKAFIEKRKPVWKGKYSVQEITRNGVSQRI